MRPLNENVPKIVFVITDGASSNRAQTLAAANEIKKRGFDIIPIGLGNINREELLLMSSTGDHFYFFERLLYANIDYTNLEFDLLKIFRQQSSKVLQTTHVVDKVSKNSYKYFKLPILKKENKITIQLKQINGSVELFYSFDDKIPKTENDFIQNTDEFDIDENFNETYLIRIKRNKFSTSFEDNLKNYTIDMVENRDALYLSVKGVGDELNEFEINIYNITIEKILDSAGSHSSAGSIFIILLIIGNIYMFQIFY